MMIINTRIKQQHSKRKKERIENAILMMLDKNKVATLPEGPIKSISTVKLYNKSVDLPICSAKSKFFIPRR